MCSDQLNHIGHIIDIANLIPAPKTPKSHSSAARRLQRVEKQLGPLVDLVVESSRSPGSSPLSSSRKPLTTSVPTAVAPFVCTLLRLLCFLTSSLTLRLSMIAATTTGIASFAPDSQSECCFSLLLQLDEIKQPGISEEKFRDLFWKRRKCCMYMTRRATVFHDCKSSVEVIDLTNED